MNKLNKLNKLVTNYPVELTPEEVGNLSLTLSAVRTAGAATEGKIYKGDGFVNVNNTNNTISLTTEANEKLNQPIPTKVSDLTDSANYQTTEGMNDYLTKTSASENLAPLSVTADIASLKNVSGDFSLYYNKNETSSKNELSSEFVKYVTTTEFNVVNVDVSTLKSASSEWNKVGDKLDKTAFSDVSGNFLTAAPENMATTDDVAKLEQTISETYQVKGEYLTTADSSNFYPSNNPSGFITGVDLSNYYNKNETSSKNELDTAFGSKQDNLTQEQLSAISSVSSIKGTVLVGDSNIRTTSSESGTNILWTLELTPQPTVTDTTLSGYDGIVATKDSTVSSQWNVGIAQAYKEQIESVSSKLTKASADNDYAPKTITATVNTLTGASASWNEVSAISRIDSVLANKKDKQNELNFNGSATKTVKKITQNVNGELHVEFEDIDLPSQVPNVEITSEDYSVKVTETTDIQTNTKKFDLSVDVPDPSTSNPLMDGTAAVGASTKYAREDHVHPSDTSKEDIANKITVILGTSDSKYPTDKAVAKFVNSSIATNTANYISNNGEPFTSVEQLEAYSGPVTNNDYAFVTGTDSEGNTYYDRYKATVKGSSVTWSLEYRLNNSSFTTAQWDAINSGITSALVAKIHDHSNKDVLDGITSSDVANWNSKQNSLTAGDNITIDGNTISSNQVFVATYGTTNFQEIKDAYDVGKVVLMMQNNSIAQLSVIDSTQIIFTKIDFTSNIIFLYKINGNNKWERVQKFYNSQLTFDTTPTAGSNNPVTSDGIKNAIVSAAGSATAKKFTGYNTSNIVTGSWYIIALKNSGDSEWERLYEFLISSNDNSVEQMRVLFSPRITGAGGFADSKVFISGHIMLDTSLLANWKFATLKDTAGTTYTALCVNGTNSNKSRSVYWNVRSVREKNDWNPVSINLDTTNEYSIISELPFNSSNSLPNCITTNTISPAISGNEFNSSLPITSRAVFNYLTQNTCNPSKPIILSCGGSNITSTGGSWTSTWKQIDCQLNGNGMLDVTASFGINIINQHTYVNTLSSGTCKLCDWSGNEVASATFSMPNNINNSIIYTVTDNISMRFVIPYCESKFANGLKVIITLPSDYTIDDQVNIANFTLTGTYWRNGTGYNSNIITYDS